MTSTVEARRASRPAPKVVRVACYVRQSVTDEAAGGFGSLDAQRAAVEHYVAIREHEGWQLLPTVYSDANESSNDMKRPAFQRLLSDIRAGLVDVLAAYRLDRVTRSQADLVRLVELLGHHHVQLVSVTEQFDTSTPMGRFALGLMVQVAQLERETTAKRVKDTTAAARQRGLWTGGRPPLGLDSVDGSLRVNESEATVVREIFRLYLKLGSLADLCGEVAARGWHNKAWTNKLDRPAGGAPFDKARLRALLSNPLYARLIRCGDELRDAKHDALVTRQTWDTVQALLATKTPTVRRKRQAWSSLLGGLLSCGCGAAMTHGFTSRGSRRYRYYTCTRIIHHNAAACPGSRVKADEIEGFVVDRLRALGRDRALVAATVEAARQHEPDLDEGALRRVLAELTPLWEVMQLGERQRIVNLLLERVTCTVAANDIQLTLRDSGVRTLARELSKETAP